MTPERLRALWAETEVALDRAAAEPAAAEPISVAGWAAAQAVRPRPAFLNAAVALAERPRRGADLPDAERARFVLALTDAWVLRAAPALRDLAVALAETLPASVRAAPCLRLWRITGASTHREAGLAAVDATAPGWERATALRAAYHATGEPAHLDGAVGACPDGPAPAWAWPLALDLRGTAPPGEPEGPPGEVALALTAAGLSPLSLRIDWHIARELTEGPVAEAVTFAWPALRVRFRRLPSREQVRFVATIDGQDEELLDAGVVSEWLSHKVQPVDRSALLASGGARGRGSLRR